MPIPFTKPEGLIGRFAVVKPWPDVQAAEDENIARLQITARSMGLECIVVDPEGVRLDQPDQRVTSRTVDFVINLHFETPKAYDAFSFVALWNPLRFYKDWGYRRYSKNLLTHDDFLSCSSTWADHHVCRMIAEDPARLAPHFTMYHSLSEPVFEPTLGHQKVFYAGINWDKLGKKKGRHQDLLLLLDKAGILRIHGPRIFNNVNVWEGYQCYVGPVPFDGVSMVKAISEAGIALVFSSDAHKESELMSNRLFESLAAGAVVICDDNPFARKFFGDTLLYVDTSETLERVAQQIKDHHDWVKKNPEAALKLARASQEIFKQRFTLDRSLATIYTQLNERKQALRQRLTPIEPAQPIQVLMALPDYAPESLDNLLESLETQTQKNLHGVLLVDAGDLARHGRQIQNRLARCPLPVEVKSVVFYERRQDGQARKRLPLGRVFASVIEALPSETVFTVLPPNERWFADHLNHLLHALQSKPENDFAFGTAIVRHIHQGQVVYSLLDEVNLTKNDQIPTGFGRFLFRRSAVTAAALDLMNFLDMRAASPLVARGRGAATHRATTVWRIHEPFVTGELVEDAFEQQIVADRYAEIAPRENLSKIQAALAHPGLNSSLQTVTPTTFQTELLRLQAAEGADSRAVSALRRLRQLLIYELFLNELNLSRCEQAVARLPFKLVAEVQKKLFASEKCDSLLAYWVGLHQEYSKRPLEALRAFNQALLNIPTGYPSHFTIRVAVKVAELCIQQGKAPVAVKLLQDVVLKMKPSHPRAHELLAKVNRPSASQTKPAPAAATPATAKAANPPPAPPAGPPLVSAIVSTYKSEKFLRGCLEDLERQTIADKLEIIVVDSNSPQNERAIVEEFQKRHSNIVYIRTKERETLYGAWNRAIRAARGKYVTTANTDDRHRADALEILARNLDQNPDVTLVYGDCLITTVENETMETTQATRRFQWMEFSAQDLLTKGCFCGPQPMWRREAHAEHGYFDASMVSAGDYEFWLRLAQNRVFLHVPVALGLYLESPTSVEHANREAGVRETKIAQDRYRDSILHGKPPFRPRLAEPEAAVETGSPPASKSAATAPLVLPAVARIGRLDEARELLGCKNFEAAWKSALVAISQRPFHPEALLLLAEIALAAGDGKAAKHCALQARDLAPNWKPAKQFLNKQIKGNAKLEWLNPSSILHPPSSPRLSVCLIVRNEEKFLPQCLASVKDIAGQIVIVDTGSTDRTVEIAQEHGAEVHSFAWCDDFSAARNAALEHATGDWVLMLDADEELPAGQHAQLRADMKRADVIACRLPLVNRGEEEQGRHPVPRLFRNAPGVYYYSRIHEQVFPSLVQLGKGWGLKTAIGTAELLHHGYAKEIIRDRNKIERNLKLLRQAVQEFPQDANLRMNLGLELVHSDDLPAALAHYREAFRLMSAQPPGEVTPELREVLLTQFTSHLYKAREHGEIVQTLASPLAKQGGLTASLHFVLGLALFELRRFHEAAGEMRQCLAQRKQPALAPINTDILTAVPHHCLALSLMKAGEVAEAEKAFQAGLAENNPAEVKLDYAKFLAGQNRPVEALQQLNELVAADSRNAAVWRLGGEIALGRPEFLEFARDWTGEAIRQLPEDGVIVAQRAEALLLSQQTTEALPLWSRAINGQRPPRALAAQIICATAASQPMEKLRDAPEEAAVSRAFVDWYRRLVTSGARETIVHLNSRVELLRPILPSAAGVLDGVLAATSAN
jgi:glycosyltransferase involved in cell wall biosynthesis